MGGLNRGGRERKREKDRQTDWQTVQQREKESDPNLAYGDDARWEDEHGDGHPGDVGLESPRLGEVAPAVVLARGHLRL